MSRAPTCKALWRLFSDKLSYESVIRFGFLSKSELIAIFDDENKREELWLVFLKKINGHNEESIKTYKEAIEAMLSNTTTESIKINFLYFNEKDCLCLDKKGGSK